MLHLPVGITTFSSRRIALMQHFLKTVYGSLLLPAWRREFWSLTQA